MNLSKIAHQLLQQPESVDEIVSSLNATDLADFVNYLKEQVDAHWWQDSKTSLQYADAIIAVGASSENKHHHALGLMARGDTLRFRGELAEAWQTLTQAADMFASVNDDVGWARTCIGKVAMSAEYQQVDEALQLAERARTIFEETNNTDKMLRINLNIAYVLHSQGRFQEAWELLQTSITVAEALGEAGIPRLRYLYQNAGYTLMYLTRFDEARTYYQSARAIFEERGESSGMAMVDENLAYISELQGRFREALNVYHQAMDVVEDEQPMRWCGFARDVVLCYLKMNRIEDALTLARDVEDRLRDHQANNYLATLLERIALAYAHLRNFDVALAKLDEAQTLYEAQDATGRIPFIQLQRAQVLLLQGTYDSAEKFARSVGEHFQSISPLEYANALLIQALASHHLGRAADAQRIARHILTLARDFNLPMLRYHAHLLLGKIAYQQQETHRAARRFQAASATINRIQQRLTLSLRSDFMADKSDAIHHLIKIYLNTGQTEKAFEELERHKSQVFWQYIVQQGSLRWSLDGDSQKLLYDELKKRRAEHHWYYRQVYEQDDTHTTRSRTELQQEMTTLERKIRHLIERLYLHSQTGETSLIQVPTIADIQTNLRDDELLIEYYSDGEHLWVFTLSTDTLAVHDLSPSLTQISQLIEQFQFNIDSVLKVGHASPIVKPLGAITRRILNQLYQQTIAPIAHLLNGRKLTIVPYGVLHYLPFHLLYDGQDYLGQKHEVSILPASTLFVRHVPQQASAARILAHSRAGQLPATQDEAQAIYDRLGGTVYRDADATRQVLEQAPCQVLHIASHGEYRIDYPELSFIELADGQLYTDDLVQQDMRYELVTLSACETGRSQIAPGDERIGLGRGFLYAGAGAVVASLWRTEDDFTASLMRQFYDALARGASKSAALQAAQKYLLDGDADLHPAFWGAFQLIGNPLPLSS